MPFPPPLTATGSESRRRQAGEVNRGIQLEDVAGYASFHGNFPDGPDWPEDTPPLLIMHGGIDQNPSIADLAAFVEEAEAAGLTYDVEIYSGADHAFTVSGGDNYQERADERSWAAFERFLDEVFEGAEG